MLHYTGNKASKNHAMAACSRDNDPAKEPGWWSACFASNANYFYHRAVRCQFEPDRETLQKVKFIIMKLIISILLCFFSIIIYGQEDNYSVIHVYRHKDLISRNKIAKIFINDSLKIGIKAGWYDTIHIKNGCYDLKTNKNKIVYNNCFQNNEYYFRIDYKYIFIIGKFNLIEVTESFANSDMKNLEKRSYKK